LLNFCFESRFWSALIGKNVTAQTTGSHSCAGGGIQIPKTSLQALSPFYSLAPPTPRELARRLKKFTRKILSSYDLSFSKCQELSLRLLCALSLVLVPKRKAVGPGPLGFATTLLVVVSFSYPRGERTKREEPLQATFWIPIKHTRVTEFCG